MRGRTILLFESRAGSQMLELIERRGATALWIPVLAELPDLDPEAVKAAIVSAAGRPFALAVFQTGVGTRALFEAATRLGLEEDLKAMLAKTQVAARGPKPTVVLRGQGVRIDYPAAEPYTTAELLAAIDALDLRGQRVLVQRHGEHNAGLHDAILARGAQIVELPLYRWAKRDADVVARALQAFDGQPVDAAVFTSMAQVQLLFETAEDQAERLRAALNHALVCSIGPVCSAALREAGVKVGLEASPPKLGPLFAAMEAALSGDRR